MLIKPALKIITNVQSKCWLQPKMSASNRAGPVHRVLVWVCYFKLQGRSTLRSKVKQHTWADEGINFGQVNAVQIFFVSHSKAKFPDDNKRNRYKSLLSQLD